MGTDAILALEEVVAGYGKMTILHGTSFAVRRGTITTLIGPNGAGKSTIFKTVFGMLPARSGKIRFDGADIEATRLPLCAEVRSQDKCAIMRLAARAHRRAAKPSVRDDAHQAARSIETPGSRSQASAR